MNKKTVAALVFIGILSFAPVGMAAQKYLTASSLKSACAAYNTKLDAAEKDANERIDSLKAEFKAAKPKRGVESLLEPSSTDWLQAQRDLQKAKSDRTTANVVCELIGNALK